MVLVLTIVHQRNLDAIGIRQSNIGKLFREKKLRLIKFYQANGADVKIQLDMLLKF